MDLDKYLDMYTNVSRKELEKMRDCVTSEVLFEFKVKDLHESREKEKLDGRPALTSGPLIQVLSVQLEKDSVEPFNIYGRIDVEYDDCVYGGMVKCGLYKRERNAPELVGTTGALTLNGPDYSCRPDHSYIPLFRSMIDVELFDGDDNVFVRECFSLERTEVENGYEQVNSVVIRCQQRSLTLRYIAIPFGLYCRIEVMFYNRKISRKISERKRDSINVNGKINVRYAKTYGNYASEECVLFEKQDNEYERVEVDQNSMQLSRCWVALPAYSSLLIGVDLSEFGTGEKIVNDSTKFLAQPGLMFGDTFILNDLFVEVCVSWFSPTPMGPHGRISDYEHEKCSPSPLGISIEEMDIDEEDESSDDESSSDLNLPWHLHPHESKPWPSPAVEIFSVFIGREKSKAVQLYGSIEVLCGGDGICYIFKRDEKDALGLSEHMKSTPILDGSRVYEEFNSLEMKFDIKDVEGQLAIKGYVDWHASVLENNSVRRDKLLCSFIQGHNGFAAVHYSIFSYAVEANVKVFLNLKTGSDLYPKVYGSLIVQYSCFDYSSRYNKDYYRSVLFRRIEDDSIQLNDDGTLPLSRSMVVVPSYSSLIISVDLSTGASGHKLSCAEEIEIKIGLGCKTIETNDCFLRMELDWCDIK